jgi:hypothetical protein
MTRATHRWTPCRCCGDIVPEGTMWQAWKVDPRWKRGLVCTPCRDRRRDDHDATERNQGMANAEADAVWSESLTSE